MFLCAVDIRSFSLRMALTVNAPVPLFLEGRSLPTDPARVLKLLRVWADFYDEAPDYLVGCHHDPWPAQLKEALHNAGYRVKWVTLRDIGVLLGTWKSIQPDIRWLRAGLMAYLCGSSYRSSGSKDLSRLTVLEWMYASMRFQLMDLEGALFTQGRDLCLEHLNPRWPLCETEPEHHESKKPCSERVARL